MITMFDSEHNDTTTTTEESTSPASDAAGVMRRLPDDCPEHVREDMKRYPWEVRLEDPWVVPDHHDKRPRKFKTREEAEQAVDEWNDCFGYVIQPRTSYNAKRGAA